VGLTTSTRKSPPRKQPGQGRGPRRIDGAVLDVRSGSLFLGWSEKTTRGLVARRLIPCRRLGARIIFIRAELEAWVTDLRGCTMDEARENLRVRLGLHG